MIDDKTKKEIQQILDLYKKGIDNADADALEALHWADEPEFRLIEDFIQKPFGAETFREIGDWIRENADPGYLDVEFREMELFQLCEDVVYAVGIVRQSCDEGPTEVRMTLIFLRRKGQWRIIHGHWSDIPEEE
jgi:ketosteroid isomerase-like protein